MLDNKYNGGHSLVSPSGASRWASCSASVRHTMNEENKGNKAAQNGTDRHWLAELMLKGDTFEKGQSVVREHKGFDGKGMFYVSQSMLDEVNGWLRYIDSVATEPDAEVISEAKYVCIPEHDVNGHVDVTLINGNELHIIDFKAGRGAVSAEENLQLQIYALGALEEHEMFYDFEEVHLHILQDNESISNINKWVTSVDDLADFKLWITERARLALQEDSECTPSEDACRYCSHSPKCDALMKFTSDALDFTDLDTEELVIGESIIADIETITALLAKKPLLDIAFKAFNQRIMDDIQGGGEVEGYKIVRGRKNKKWLNEIEAFDKLKTWATLDEVAPRKLATPTQVTKLLGKDISTRKLNTFNELWEQPEGDLKVVPSSNKSPAVIFEKFKDLDTDL